MVKLLKAAGSIALVIGLYFASYFAASLIFQLVYLAGYVPGPSLQQFIIGNTVPISTAGAALALLFFWLIFALRGKRLWRYCRLHRTTAAINLLAALLLGAGFSFFTNAVISMWRLDSFFPQYREMMEIILQNTSLPANLLAVGLFIPFFEEVLFRGIIFNRLRADFPVVVSLPFQALIFGLVHGNVLQSSYALLGGLFIGLVYIWSGSLLIPVAAHMAWNTVSIFIARLLGGRSPREDLIMLLFGLISVTWAIICLKNHRNEDQERDGDPDSNFSRFRK